MRFLSTVWKEVRVLRSWCTTVTVGQAGITRKIPTVDTRRGMLISNETIAIAIAVAMTVAKV